MPAPTQQSPEHAAEPAGHGGETFPMAQAIKDATMAHVAGMQDEFRSLQGLYRFRPEQAVGVGYNRREFHELTRIYLDANLDTNFTN